MASRWYDRELECGCLISADGGGCFGLWIWECPHKNCTGCSKKPLSRIKAKRSGVKHLRDFHDEDERDVELILKKV